MVSQRLVFAVTSVVVQPLPVGGAPTRPTVSERLLHHCSTASQDWRARSWRLGWLWHGSAGRNLKGWFLPGKGEQTEIICVWLKKDHSAQQLGDVVARELFRVAGEKGW